MKSCKAMVDAQDSIALLLTFSGDASVIIILIPMNLDVFCINC